MRKFLLSAVVALAVALPATSGTFNYVNWTSSSITGGVTTVLGTLPGGINVTYTGESAFVQTNGGGTNWYGGFAGVYTNGVVSNMPPDSDIIAIVGNGSVDTLTFSAPVSGLIMDLVSLGQPSVLTSYTFDRPFSILSMGPAWWGGPGTLLASNGNTTLTGVEGDGVVQFAGSLSTLSWTGATGEYWNGFTFGTPTAVPEPATWGLMLAGLAMLGLRRVRR
jgi:hypothetical protein